MFLPNACEVVSDGADRQPPDQGEVGAEQDEGIWFSGETGKVEVPAETSEDSALTGPVPLRSSGDCEQLEEAGGSSKELWVTTWYNNGLSSSREKKTGGGWSCCQPWESKKAEWALFSLDTPSEVFWAEGT